jgi:hypothetical protein
VGERGMGYILLETADGVAGGGGECGRAGWEGVNDCIVKKKK